MSEANLKNYVPTTVFGPEPGVKIISGRTSPGRNITLQPATSSNSGAVSSPVGIPSASSNVPIPIIQGPQGPQGRDGKDGLLGSLELPQSSTMHVLTARNGVLSWTATEDCGN